MNHKRSEATTNSDQKKKMSLEKWAVFSLLDAGFISKIRLACVFGSSGNEAIVITNEDNVYSLGSNCCSCLGLGDSSGSLEPRKLEKLCGKSIKDIAYGSGPHVIAMTEIGELYTWGHNGYCQLGNGNSNQGFHPELMPLSSINFKIGKIACGSHHSVALTVCGEVFSWGHNNCGQVGVGVTTNIPIPKKVGGALTGRMVCGVACGQTSTMAVIENGEVYGWGYNGNGQLGIGNNSNQSCPAKVSNLQYVIIQQVVCGYAHTMALSDEGFLYAWGANSYGQLGTGNKANFVSPTKIATEIGRVVEIAASHYNHISVAMTQNCRVYMWGQCRGQSMCTPTQTLFENLNDVFTCFASPGVTWKPIMLDAVPIVSVSDSIKKSFNDEETGDIKFSIEGKIIHAHKAVLKIRCEYFRSMFQSQWAEDMKDTLEITDFTHPVYEAFIKYLYTDTVDLPPEEAIGLLDLANAYCEQQLKRECERLIRHGITIENTAMLYAVAIKYEAKKLEDFCFMFALNHMTSVVQTEAFRKLDEQTVKNFIDLAAKRGAFRH